MQPHPSSAQGRTFLALDPKEKRRSERPAGSFQACHLCLVTAPHCPADTSYHLSQIIQRISMNQLLSPLFTLVRCCFHVRPAGVLAFPRAGLFSSDVLFCFMKGATHAYIPSTLFGKDTLRYNLPAFLPEIRLFCLLPSTQGEASQPGQAPSHLPGGDIPVLSLLLVKFLSLEGFLPHCHEQQQVTHQLSRKPGRESPSS